MWLDSLWGHAIEFFKTTAKVAEIREAVARDYITDA